MKQATRFLRIKTTVAGPKQSDLSEALQPLPRWRIAKKFRIGDFGRIFAHGRVCTCLAFENVFFSQVRKLDAGVRGIRILIYTSDAQACCARMPIPIPFASPSRSLVLNRRQSPFLDSPMKPDPKQ